MSDITPKVKQFAREKGADLVGVASKECFKRLPKEGCMSPERLLPRARSVVVIGVRKSKYVHRYVASWQNLEYLAAELAFVTGIANRLASYLEDLGYEVFPVSNHGAFRPRELSVRTALQTITVDREGNLQGLERLVSEFRKAQRDFPLRTLAVEAGLGQMSICGMVVTPQFGPRVRFSAVVTDADLEADRRFTEELCPASPCRKSLICVKACPGNAISENGVNLGLCILTMYPWVLKLLGKADEEQTRSLLPGSMPATPSSACSKCIWVCPIGTKKFRAQHGGSGQGDKGF